MSGIYGSLELTQKMWGSVLYDSIKSIVSPSPPRFDQSRNVMDTIRVGDRDGTEIGRKSYRTILMDLF